MRLLGFTPTRKMLIEEARPLVTEKVVNDEAVVDVIHDEPITVPVVEHIPSVELPRYTKPVKKLLPPLIIPVKKKSSSELKRKVALNPLSN